MFKKIKKLNIVPDRGFSLIEMVVAMGIFSFAALIGTTALLSISTAQKKAFAIQSAFDNLRFVVEIVAKDLRTGSTYHCGDLPNIFLANDCPMVGGGNDTDLIHDSITYIDATSQVVSLRRSTEVVDGNTVGFLEKSLDNGVTWAKVTGDDVNLSKFRFYVKGSGFEILPNPQFQPVVTIVAEGVAGVGKWTSKFNLQTTVTQRSVIE